MDRDSKWKIVAVTALVQLLAPVTVQAIRIEGRVFDGSGNGLAGARVQLVPMLPAFETDLLRLREDDEPEVVARATSGVEGRFEVVAPGPGMWSVVVAAEGRLSMAARLVPLVQDVTLPTVDLPPASPVRIRLTDSEAGPVVSALVLAKPAVEERGMEVWETAPRRTTSGENGVASLLRAPGEALRILARAPGFAEAARGPVRGSRIDLVFEPAEALPAQVLDPAGRPVAGALLRVGEGRWPLGTTGGDGRMRVDWISGRPLRLEVETVDGGAGVSHVRVEDETQARVPVPVRLSPASVLSGRIVDAASGEAVPGALVWVPRDPGGFVVTGPRGEFRLDSLRATDRTVQVGAVGYFDQTHRLTAPGEGRKATATVAMTPSITVRGTVVNGRDTPVAGADVHWTLRIGPQPSLTSLLHRGGGLSTSGSDGRFTVSRLLPGETYELRVSKAGYAAATTTISRLQTFDAREDLRVVLEEGRTGRVKVVDADGAPVAGARVVLRSRPEGLSGLMSAMLAGGREASPSYEGETGQDGLASMRDLPAVSFDLVADAPGFARVTVPGIEVPEGAGVVDLGTVSLVAAAVLEGYVIDPQGNPVEGAAILIGSTDPFAALVEARRRGEETEPDARTAGDGWFRVEDLIPGERVRVRATHPSHAEASALTDVPAEPPLEIVLEVAASLAGRVVDEDGEPLRAALVGLYDSGDPPGPGLLAALPASPRTTVATDERGRFEVRAIHPGLVELEVAARGFEVERIRDLELEPGQALQDLVVELTSAAQITGRITSAEGRPVPGARVHVVREVGSGSALQQAFGFSLSDGDGRYRLDSVSPGPKTVAAEHDDYQKVVREIDADRGDNELDITFDRGHEITGRVQDAFGEPLPGALLTLFPPGRALGGRRATAGPEGSFAFRGVRPGEYSLRGEKEGYAAAEEVVSAVSGSVQGVELRLGEGGAVVGRIHGLELDDLSRVRVVAVGPGSSFQMGRVVHDGSFRIDSLAPGSWQVIASLLGSGRQAEGSVTLESGALEAWLDLEFGAGWVVSGAVLQGGRPVSGRAITVVGMDVSDGGMVDTDQRGRFRIEGLATGTYEVEVLGLDGSVQHSRTVEIDSDREVSLEIPVGEITGQATAESDGAQLSGVAITAQPTADAGPGQRSDTTDSAGRFRLGGLAEGTYLLTGEKEGFATATTLVDLSSGGSVGDVELRLRPTRGLDLEVRRPGGWWPDDVDVAVLDASGRVRVSGRYPVLEDGRIRLTSVPRGDWRVLVSAAGTSVVELSVKAPGQSVPVSLPDEGRLVVRVPALESSDRVAEVGIRLADGRPFERLESGGALRDRWRLVRGALDVGGLQAGKVHVTVSASDGTAWEGVSEVMSGAVSELRLD